MTKRTGFYLGGVVILIAAASLVGQLVARSNDDDSAVDLYERTAATMVIPANTKMVSESSSVDPLRATRIWQTDDGIDDACNAWRDAYRAWIGPENVGAVTGEVLPGQYCNYAGRKNEQNTRLQVAVYGNQPPQATLTVTP